MSRSRTGRLLLFGLALLTAAFGLPASTAGAKSPQGGGYSAVIRYTEHGIPHIVAAGYADLGFGTGWAQAADQVCPLADTFVTLRGERSRHFGADGPTDTALSSASGNLASDLYFRGVREAGTVEELFAQKAPAGPSREMRAMVRGWAAGYNAWLAQREITDPACKDADWVRPVTELDVAFRSYALAVLGGHGMSVDGITAARPPTTAGAAPPAAPAPDQAADAARRALDNGEAAMGSNAVAFHGATTANGRGLLLGNPHYPWHGGRRFWQSQQTIPGELNAAGGSLLGAVSISIGHNSAVAWSHTVATGVPANLHQLTLDPADPTAYLVDGRSERMTRRTVTVETKDGPPVTRSQWWTRYGPVLTAFGRQLPLPWTASTAYALNDPNAANLRAADTALGFSRARSTADIRDALRRTQGLPWVNTVAADRAGRTLFTQSQVLPRITEELAARCSTPLGRAVYPASGLAILDGSRTDCAPGSDPDAVQPGIFGPSRMPTLVDAPYAVNSNDSAWLANPRQPLTGYERVFGDQGTQRSMRTRGGLEDVAALAERGGLTVADLQHQQFTTGNRAHAGHLAARDLAAACAALPGGMATAGDGSPVDVSGACPVLRDWDRTMLTGSRGALLFDRFWRRAAPLGAAQLWKTPFDPADPVRTPHTLNTASPGVLRALADAVAELGAAGIALDSPLGEHQFVVRNGTRIPVPGGTESLGVWNKVEPRWNPAEGGYPEVTTGSSYIQAVGWDATQCPVARTLLTYSQSANPNSPYYSDQTEKFSQGRWVTPPFCERDIRHAPGLRVVRVHD
ncbi:penicillin acylase family protein [Streptomyces polyrhachis]|uniref:Penicillin acylase family protein n=1 Tax=Streptomyces polyrhachis TaxID=1282885 RepID=A0ABW2GMB1_9ACTN